MRIFKNQGQGDGGDGKHHEKAISKLLAEIKELRHENQLLRKKAIINENGLVRTTLFFCRRTIFFIQHFQKKIVNIDHSKQF